MAEFLVTGAGGMLGKSWVKLLSARGIDHLGAPRGQLDIGDSAVVERFVVPGVKWVINCAAWTAVDAAEDHPDEANTINGVAVGRLAEKCKKVDAKLIHYSTDYVFDGKASQPYQTDHPRAPVNAYGRSKALGEELLERSGADYLLVRSSWLYAPWGKNFVLTIADFATKRPELEVVDDQRGRPSSCDNIAKVTLALMEKGCHGVYHVSDGGECTWFELATLIGQVVNPDCRILPCGSDAFPRPAARPAYSVLDITETERLVGPMPEWKGQVVRALQERR